MLIVQLQTVAELVALELKIQILKFKIPGPTITQQILSSLDGTRETTREVLGRYTMAVAFPVLDN